MEENTDRNPTLNVISYLLAVALFFGLCLTGIGVAGYAVQQLWAIALGPLGVKNLSFIQAVALMGLVLFLLGPLIMVGLFDRKATIELKHIHVTDDSEDSDGHGSD